MKTKVYNWDEVFYEVGECEVEVPDGAMPEDVYQAWQLAIGETPNPETGKVEDDPEYGFHSRTDLGEMTLMTGRFGRDKQFMMWWGPGADLFGETITKIISPPPIKATAKWVGEGALAGVLYEFEYEGQTHHLDLMGMLTFERMTGIRFDIDDSQLPPKEEPTS